MNSRLAHFPQQRRAREQTSSYVVLGVMLDRLTLPALPVLRGKRGIPRGPRKSDIDDRLRHPIDPEEEDGYGSSVWRQVSSRDH